MLHFSNQELAERYHVSIRTVRNWIEAARAGKLELTLQTQGERTFIANTSKNIATIEKISESGKKFRPHRAYKILSPRPEFYEVYTQEQIYDIVSNIEIYHEVPNQYNYMDAGATAWNDYAQKMADEDTLNSLRATHELLEANLSYFDHLLAEYDQVNILDIGVGNALPVRYFLQHFLDNGKLGKYFAVDISQDLLNISESNITRWFGDKIEFQTYQLDVTRERFTNILTKEYTKKKSKKTANLFLLFGSLLANFRAPSSALTNIHDSMGSHDYLVYETKLDSDATRRYFDFNTNPSEITLPPIFSTALHMLNIDPSMYDVDLGYSTERSERYEGIRLKVAVTLKFDFKDGERTVDLNKGDSLLIWRHKQLSALSVMHQFDQNNFYPLHTSQTDSQEYLLSISRIKGD